MLIDSEIARRVRAAQRRVRICSLLINSGTLIGELGNLLGCGRVTVDGIYDRTQMQQVYLQWQEVPQNRWKIGALKEIIMRAGLVGKNSAAYTPIGPHNFMHNKILVIDDVNCEKAGIKVNHPYLPSNPRQMLKLARCPTCSSLPSRLYLVSVI